MPQNVGADGKEKIQGGTAVDGSSSRVTLIALGLLLGVIVLVVMARRGSESEPDSHLPTAGVQGPATAVPARPTPTGATGNTATAEPSVGFLGVDAAVNTPEEARRVALGDMEKQLAERRLWSKVTADQDVPTDIIVSSAACTDAIMKATLEATAESLKAAGFTGLRCVEKSGAMVFQLEL